MGSSDTHHKATIWLTQGATHLRCSSGSELRIAAGAELDVVGKIDMNSGSTLGIDSGANISVSGSVTMGSNGTIILQSGSTLLVNPGGSISVSSGGYFKNKGPRATTATKNTSTLDPWGFHAINTSGVYEINPKRGSVCTIFMHTTANAFFKGSSALDPVRFPTSAMRVLKVKGTTKDQKRWGGAFQIIGLTSHRAYVGALSGFSSDAHDTKLIIAETSTT